MEGGGRGGGKFQNVNLQAKGSYRKDKTSQVHLTFIIGIIIPGQMVFVLRRKPVSFRR